MRNPWSRYLSTLVSESAAAAASSGGPFQNSPAMPISGLAAKVQVSVSPLRPDVSPLEPSVRSRSVLLQFN